MACKYYEEYDGICTNPKCPMVADCCPVPDVEGLCRHEERDEDALGLTPKGCAVAALMDADFVYRPDDPEIDVFWNRFAELMEKNGYVEEKL